MEYTASDKTVKTAVIATMVILEHIDLTYLQQSIGHFSVSKLNVIC